jgi:hypothetical protein
MKTIADMLGIRFSGQKIVLTSRPDEGAGDVHCPKSPGKITSVVQPMLHVIDCLVSNITLGFRSMFVHPPLMSIQMSASLSTSRIQNKTHDLYPEFSSRKEEVTIRSPVDPGVVQIVHSISPSGAQPVGPPATVDDIEPDLSSLDESNSTLSNELADSDNNFDAPSDRTRSLLTFEYDAAGIGNAHLLMYLTILTPWRGSFMIYKCSHSIVFEISYPNSIH